MPNLLDLIDSADSADGALQEVKIGKNPVAILLFTADAVDCDLHFEEDPSVNAYVRCPGAGCPLCGLGSRPEKFLLLPVVELQSSRVRVLRMSRRRGEGALLTLLGPCLRRSDLADFALLLSRSEPTKFQVLTKKIMKHADRGEAAVAAFEEARADGLDLASAFLTMTADELREIPRVRKLLDAIGDEPLDLDDASDTE